MAQGNTGAERSYRLDKQFSICTTKERKKVMAGKSTKSFSLQAQVKLLPIEICRQSIFMHCCVKSRQSGQ